MRQRVLVGISGGLDSAATVKILQEQGYRVEALYLDMLDHAPSRARVQALSQQLGVPLHMVACRDLFEAEIIRYVLESHQVGLTPSPCTRCNPAIKWALMAREADRLGIHALATGHYIRIGKHADRYYMAKGVDPIKDQSYYLYQLPQSILSRAITPLGTRTKTEVRSYLKQCGFPALAAGGESQGVCFAKEGYNAFLRNHLPLKEGEVVDECGNVIGWHRGTPLYTIGQKRGYTLFPPHIGEVRAIDPIANRLVVGTPLCVSTIEVALAYFAPLNSEHVTAHIRGLGRNVTEAVQVKLQGERACITAPTQTFWAPAPGQPVVFYNDEWVVGGGVML